MRTNPIPVLFCTRGRDFCPFSFPSPFIKRFLCCAVDALGGDAKACTSHSKPIWYVLFALGRMLMSNSAGESIQFGTCLCAKGRLVSFGWLPAGLMGRLCVLCFTVSLFFKRGAGVCQVITTAVRLRAPPATSRLVRREHRHVWCVCILCAIFCDTLRAG